ncbi:CoB--CoM heterodisulfide reductase iron-sulfur subunit B family protein [Desulforudis sp. 1031]|uniref:CoB--CoM heterodisulfide reductase iron-sulfur subunit B family protein n=3 Tax=Candidatus Desulforudis TaxID=471826 RepID=UPI003CE5B6A2
MKVSFYPGCSLESTAREYSASSRAVCEALEVELREIKDWNCCGATSVHSLNSALALALPARNLALARDEGRAVVTPCAACYSRLRLAQHTLRRDKEKRRATEEVLGLPLGRLVEVWSLLELITEQIGLDRVAGRVRQPLGGLKVACYYGCLLVRPAKVTGMGRPEDPRWLDDLMSCLGAEVRPWSYKTDCCGASHAITNPDVARGLVGRLLDMAGEAGAEALVTACPLCQTNFETQRPRDNDRPTFYFTELMGLAFGLPETKNWLSKHLVDPVPLLVKLGLI